jgi:hypothetical protein
VRIVGAISGFASVLGSRRLVVLNCLVLLSILPYGIKWISVLVVLKSLFVRILINRLAALISKSITCLAKGLWTFYNSKL